MTTSATLRASQTRAGQPINMQGQLIFDATSWAAMGDRGIGVKATGAAPTNFSDFLHVREPGSTLFAYDQTDHTRFAGITLTSEEVRGNFRLVAPIDTNFVVGRHVFAFSADGSGAILAVSAPYTIR